MNRLRQFLFRLGGLFRKRRLEAEMSAELQEHLELRIERNIQNGMTPDEARYAAMRSFGGVEQIKEIARDQRGVRWLSDFIHDVRFALRQLGKSPGFTLVAVLSLTLGIGANTAIFSALDKTLLRSLAVKNPGELVCFRWLSGPKGTTPSMSGGGDVFKQDPSSGRTTGTIFSLPTFERIHAQNAVLADAFAFAP